jgi:membrane protein DedA with SNARE-associated domain
VFVGRFLGTLRATVPVVAGVIEMGNRRLELANLLSAMIWVPIICAPGYFAAESLGPNLLIDEVHLMSFALGIVLLTARRHGSGRRYFW